MSALRITERRAGDVIVLDLEGNITIGEDRVALHDVTRRLLANGDMNILLNMAQVKLVDSSGLGALVSIYTTITRVEGQVKLLHVTRIILNLMTVTKLATVFDIYDDELAALNDYTLGDQFKLACEGEVSERGSSKGEMYEWATPHNKQ